jgi:alpha-1,3-mannosyl-glycoprotein beta-1,2-N-acetylglucosaminyltransferase
MQDDMQLAPDFFAFFAALAPVLDRDPTLYCVSSWNDHGQVGWNEPQFMFTTK